MQTASSPHRSSQPRRPFREALAVTALVLLSASAVSAPAKFTDLATANIPSRQGTLELRVRLFRDISADLHNHVFLLGVSSDATERYEIQVLKDKLIARRYFGSCLLTAFAHSHRFRAGDWHPIRLSWNGGTTTLQVDGRDVVKIGPLSSGDLGKQIPAVRLGRDDSFEVSGFQTSSTSITEEPADRDFVGRTTCPNLAELLDGPPQEQYRGIARRHFPDRPTREKIKSFADLLPDPMTSSIAHVVFVEDARAAKNGALGEALLGSRAIVLKGSSAGDASVFFHEAAHLHDYALKINFGVAEADNRWAAISGASCYKKETDLVAFWNDFQKTHVQNGILHEQGGQCASEDLAIWVGAAYETYLKKKTLSDMLDASSPKYSAKNRQKLDFLFGKGFFSKTLYDAIAPR